VQAELIKAKASAEAEAERMRLETEHVRQGTRPEPSRSVLLPPLAAAQRNERRSNPVRAQRC